MCHFHRILGVANGQDISIYYDPSNSHSEMRQKLGIENLPNRKTVIFEAEWSGEGEIPSDAKLIRNIGECPEPLRKKIRNHYQKLKEALNEGKHLDGRGYFFDHKKWTDVWEAAMNKGHMPDFSNVETFTGCVYVRQGATLTAPKLSEVTGYVDVRQGATLTAPKLAKTGSVDVQQGATLTAPALAEVTGSVYVQQGATLTAPKLAKTGSVDVRQGATLTAPKLAEVTGYVDVQQGATLTAPALAEVTGSVDVRQGATLTAPKLSEVTGSVDVRQGATLTAPKLKKGKK